MTESYEQYEVRMNAQAMRDHPFVGDGPYCKHMSRSRRGKVTLGAECGYLPKHHPGGQGDPYPFESIDARGALEERRQTAREAFHDARADAAVVAVEVGIEPAIEAATRVRITEEIIDAFKAYAHPAPLEPNIVPALTAAFRAAGFEVEP